MKIKRVKLITLMAEKEIKGIELAAAAGLARQTISAVRGGKSCDYDTAAKIAGALNVPVMDLIDE